MTYRDGIIRRCHACGHAIGRRGRRAGVIARTQDGAHTLYCAGCASGKPPWSVRLARWWDSVIRRMEW